MDSVSLLLSVASLSLVTAQTTEYNSYNYTVTYNPGIDCLPYDGSVVPDCSKFVDPITKQPYYHEHSSSKYTKDQRPVLTQGDDTCRLQQVLGVRTPGRDLSVCLRSLPALP